MRSASLPGIYTSTNPLSNVRADSFLHPFLLLSFLSDGYDHPLPFSLKILSLSLSTALPPARWNTEKKKKERERGKLARKGGSAKSSKYRGKRRARDAGMREKGSPLR